MTKQWHNPKIPKKPFVRYNPSLKQNIASVYRPWYLVVAFLSLFIGVALIGCSSALKQYDTDLRDELFHLWVAIPLVIAGIFALACFVFKKKNMVTAFLIVSIIIMVVCAVGALTSGIRFWMDNWQKTRRALDDNKCALNKDNKCVCTDIAAAVMPSLIDDCDDLETMVNLVITEIALCAGGFIASVIAVYLSFMSICCAPWMYAEWYEEHNDPDFNKGEPVRHVAGNVSPTYNVNSAYGNSGYH